MGTSSSKASPSLPDAAEEEEELLREDAEFLRGPRFGAEEGDCGDAVGAEAGGVSGPAAGVGEGGFGLGAGGSSKPSGINDSGLC